MMRGSIMLRTPALVATGALIAAALAAGPALADGHLVGDWVSDPGHDGRGARTGPVEHDDTTADHYMSTSDMVWTLRIEDQDGSAVHAQWCSPNLCEDAVGVLRADGETLLLADEDGIFMGALMGEDTMELCYLEASADVRIADCHMLSR
jgi:hypothetical protein